MKLFVNDRKRHGTPKERHQALRQCMHLLCGKRHNYKRRRVAELVDFILSLGSRKCSSSSAGRMPQVFKQFSRQDGSRSCTIPVTEIRWEQSSRAALVRKSTCTK